MKFADSKKSIVQREIDLGPFQRLYTSKKLHAAQSLRRPLRVGRAPAPLGRASLLRLAEGHYAVHRIVHCWWHYKFIGRRS
jgi:hypothetical protein